MTDREKIIKALEHCAPGANSCTKCPMLDRCHGTVNAAMVAAIDLLKEDEIELNSLGESLNRSVELIRKLKGLTNSYDDPPF